MKAEITWLGHMRFIANADSNRGIIAEAPEEGCETETLGPTPMELMLMGIGTCTASDVVWVLKKSRTQFDKLEIRMQAERAPEDPKRFTKIHIDYVLTGKGLKDKVVSRAIRLSQEKYCSAMSSVVLGGVTVTASHTIVES